MRPDASGASARPERTAAPARRSRVEAHKKYTELLRHASFFRLTGLVKCLPLELVVTGGKSEHLRKFQRLIWKIIGYPINAQE
ncbi:hypothetical protein CXQ84_28310 [Burkholderia pseudomallei]|nr:hypothetical protein CXQ84_28310 [Burkholderia pseudomallei]